MNFDGLLMSMQSFLGEQVLLSLAPVGRSDAAPIGVRGSLERGVSTFLQGPGYPDEAVVFHIGPDAHITLQRSHIRVAAWLDDEQRVLWFDQGGLMVTICRAHDARRLQEKARELLE